MSSPTPDENSRLGRLEGQGKGIAKRVPRMQEELGHHTAEMVELTRGISAIKEGLVHMSEFLELRITGLRQGRLDTSSPTLSRGPAESIKLPMSIYYGDRSNFPNPLKLF